MLSSAISGLYGNYMFNLKETAKLFSEVTVFYIPTGNVWGI